MRARIAKKIATGSGNYTQAQIATADRMWNKRRSSQQKFVAEDYGRKSTISWMIGRLFEEGVVFFRGRRIRSEYVALCITNNIAPKE